MSQSIMIDVGHGGTDSGAFAFGIKEKDWNLKMSLYQFNRLKTLGASVDISRTNDQTLDSYPRTTIIKKGQYDYCISNHFNAFNGKARGIETIHSIFGGKRFATLLADELVKATGLPLRRVFSKENDFGTDWYFMHRLTENTETVIIEYGFLDNQADHDWYKNDTNFYKAAEAVIKAVCKQIGITYNLPSNHTTIDKGSGKQLYKVQTGAFKDIKNAEALSNKLENDGYDTYIVYDGLSPAPQPKRKSVEDYADMIEQTTITGIQNRANYLGLTLDEYEPVQQELNRRYS